MNESQPMNGRVICFTGALKAMTRRQASQIVANMGGKTTNTVTRKTTTLVMGCKPGPKVEAALLKDITIWNEQEFMQRVKAYPDVEFQQPLPLT